MKKFFVIAAIFLTYTVSAFSAPEDYDTSEATLFDLMAYETEDFDPTTAFIDLGLDDIINESTIDANDVIAYAKTYLGRPYSYGSKGPKAFDCSGFTSFVFRNFDIKLSASSSSQSTQGVGVARNEIQPGDLVFFRGRGNKGIGHVGLAIEADGEGDVTFIHAANGGGVRIDRLSKEPYYQQRYVCARRVLN